MYRALAEVYDPVYSFKDYRRESRRLLALARRYVRSGGYDWLDVACGTGRHLEQLAPRYRCVGVDASPEMLRIARRRLPGVRLVRGELGSFRLGRRFDVVSCLFSSIGYVKGVAGLRRAVQNLAGHLKPGGLLILEPWLPPEKFEAGHVSGLLIDTPTLKVARMNDSRVVGRSSVLQMHYLIGRPGKPVRHVVSIERLGLFPTALLLRLLRAQGLSARFDPHGLMPGRGLFLASAPSPDPPAARRRGSRSNGRAGRG